MKDCKSQVPPVGSVASHPLEALRRLQVVDRTIAANLREVLRQDELAVFGNQCFRGQVPNKLR